jgi:DNA-directed RNA polymerase subunit F
LLKFLKNTIYFLLIMVPSLYFGYIGKAAEMGLAIAAGALTVMFLNLDKFQSFSAAGVQAELKKTVEEAYATIEQIKEIITPFIWSSITNLTYQNRWAGMPVNEEVKYTKQLESLISSLGIDDPEVSKAIEKYNRFRTWDYFGHFKRELLKENRNDELERELESLRNFESTKFPTIEKITSICNKYNMEINVDARSWLDEYVRMSKKFN